MRFEYFNLLQLKGSRAWFDTSDTKQTEAVFQICTPDNPNPNPKP